MDVLRVDNSELRAIFLALPKLIYGELRESSYTSRDCPNDAAEEAALLTGEHLLSPLVEIEAYLLFTGGGRRLDDCLARIALVIDRSLGVAVSPRVYFGFFDARENCLSIGPLIERLEERARYYQSSKLIGPINASFLLSYRMKIDQFEATAYFGEPINPPHYPRLLEAAGFNISVRYQSNFYAAKSQLPQRMKQRQEQFAKLGYSIRAPKRSEIKELLPQLYQLLTELYQDFPAYQPIDQSSFIALFKQLTLIIDRSLVRLARYKGETVGFCIAFPDYGSRLGSGYNTMEKLLTIVRKKKMKRAVLLYIGVQPAHLGLAMAMIADLKASLDRRALSLVGALIHEGKITADYAVSEIIQTNHYALFAKALSSNEPKPDKRAI